MPPSKNKPADDSKNTTPDSRFANTTPTSFDSASQLSWILEGMMEMQRTFGRVEKAIESLEIKVGEQTKTLTTNQKTLWFAAGVVTIASVLIGFFVQHNYDRLAAILQPPPAAISAPAIPTPSSAPPKG